MKIFITKNGRRNGPYSPQQLKDLLARGEISLSDRAWYEGCAEWSRIQEMPELIQAFSQTVPSKPKVRPSKPSAPSFNRRLRPLWQKFKTMRKLHLAMACGMILLIPWVWNWTESTDAVVPMAEPKPAETNFADVQAVMKQDGDFAAVMQIKRKVIPTGTDEGLSALGLLMQTYATNGLRINLSACPRDFAEAHTRVFTAWQQEAQVISKHPHVPEGSSPIVEGFFRNLDQDVIDTMTEPPEGLADWFEQVTSAQHAVEKARQALDSLAAKYGARP